MEMPTFLRLGGIWLLLLVFFSFQASAWNWVGHRVIAQIAYEHLTSKARYRVDQLTQLLDRRHRLGVARFVRMSTWPDQWRENGVHLFDEWHYIDLDDSKSNLDRPNIVWAIKQIDIALSNPKVEPYEKAVLLVFMVHLVGDIHQPLHTVSCGTTFPRDKGGNLYPIQEKSGSLHAFWDQGLGLLTSRLAYPIPHFLSVVHQLDIQFGRRAFKESMRQPVIMNWARESAALARKYACVIPKNTVPSRRYIRQGRRIIKARLVLAGYQLAHLLNNLRVGG